MEKQLAASEVRRLSNRIPRSNDEIADAQEALRAFADLLEAREKAVPVAYALFTEKGLIRTWSREWFADAHGASVNPTPLYVHPTPADTERLAEALQPFANLFQALYATMPDDRPIYGINKAEITAGDLRRANEALAAHSAHSDTERLADQHDGAFQQAVQEARRVWMDEFPCEAGHDHVTPFDQFLYGNRPCMEAQPPAVSVTDAIACRMVAEYDAVLCGDPTATRTDGMRAALEAALAAQENPNG